MRSIGIMYALGTGVKKDKKISKEWYDKATIVVTKKLQ